MLFSAALINGLRNRNEARETDDRKYPAGVDGGLKWQHRNKVQAQCC